ncbi:MAG: SMP-30/gluconolactonase/LRE family protein, partial [Leeuwenhoekiella sp.]
MLYTSMFNRLLSIILLLFTIFCNAQTKNLIAEGAKLKLVADGYSFTEGPASDKMGNVYFTDQPNDRILKWDPITDSVTTYMSPSDRSNGLYFDNDENLISAADEHTALLRITDDQQK